MNDLVKTLAVFGASIIFVIICIVLYGLFCFIREGLSKLRWMHQYKHRFDKPPTAKCYCRDCKRHNDTTQICYKFDMWRTADEWFCWDAEPREEKKGDL